MKKGQTIYTIWKIIDSHWCNVNCTNVDTGQVLNLFPGLLCDYLWSLGFDIPGNITYCLAENTSYSIKFRHFGASIHLYVKKL